MSQRSCTEWDFAEGRFQMEQTMSSLTIEEFISRLSSSQPAPGGGGAAALCGAVGAALASMVASLTVGKKRYAEAESRMQTVIEEADGLAGNFFRLMEEDRESFLPLTEAWKMPKDSDEEKAARQEAIEQALYEAAGTPCRIMETTCKAIKLMETAEEYGSAMAMSDAGCAAALLEGTLRAASLNVFVNTRMMKNRQMAALIDAAADNMLEEYLPRASAAYEKIREKLRRLPG